MTSIDYMHSTVEGRAKAYNKPFVTVFPCGGPQNFFCFSSSNGSSTFFLISLTPIIWWKLKGLHYVDTGEFKEGCGLRSKRRHHVCDFTKNVIPFRVNSITLLENMVK